MRVALAVVVVGALGCVGPMLTRTIENRTWQIWGAEKAELEAMMSAAPKEAPKRCGYWAEKSKECRREQDLRLLGFAVGSVPRTEAFLRMVADEERRACDL